MNNTEVVRDSIGKPLRVKDICLFLQGDYKSKVRIDNINEGDVEYTDLRTQISLRIGYIDIRDLITIE